MPKKASYIKIDSVPDKLYLTKACHCMSFPEDEDGPCSRCSGTGLWPTRNGREIIRLIQTHGNLQYEE